MRRKTFESEMLAACSSALAAAESPAAASSGRWYSVFRRQASCLNASGGRCCRARSDGLVTAGAGRDVPAVDLSCAEHFHSAYPLDFEAERSYLLGDGAFMMTREQRRFVTSLDRFASVCFNPHTDRTTTSLQPAAAGRLLVYLLAGDFVAGVHHINYPRRRVQQLADTKHGRRQSYYVVTFPHGLDDDPAFELVEPTPLPEDTTTPEPGEPAAKRSRQASPAEEDGVL
ncbi:P-loop containing nucleoside triphosphate hydrolase [Micractinium conductrix]|uniref:P-loop containing nucleoside triphosphate hydrolase n=1 Tax=Micractinium conductrix TaxID=554055 RepID=A0A2P6VR66_9CHLO|nr:P-loop containing nucleoside triphosphate hydrolase [Micractinium conductrix]|eukprot:PSC76589.1 P-loop containing nucleoside triphosphate hydrolase [Micractinium conductrix]